MKPRFCPSCGKETDALVEGLCEDCFKKTRLAELPKTIKIRVCKKCGKVEGTQTRQINEKNIEKPIKKSLKVNGKLEKIKINEIEGKKNIKVQVEVQGLLKGKMKKKEILETHILIRDFLCQTCGKVRGGYYEAVIQVRSHDREKASEALNILVGSINKRGHVTKIEKMKNGADIYLTPKKILNRILKEITGIKELKRSYTLVTKKEGKDLYRNTVLVRL